MKTLKYREEKIIKDVWPVDVYQRQECQAFLRKSQSCFSWAQLLRSCLNWRLNQMVVSPMVRHAVDAHLPQRYPTLPEYDVKTQYQ